VLIPNNDSIIAGAATTSERPISGTDPITFSKRDLHAHADKDGDLELETSMSSKPVRAQTTSEQSPSIPISTNAAALDATDTNAGFSATPHVVKRGENFWTISRQYFATGSYWIALWKSNSEKYPEIDKLRVGDVIMVPPVEALDLTATDPRQTRRGPAEMATPSASNSKSHADRTGFTESVPNSSSRRDAVSIDKISRSSYSDDDPVQNNSEDLVTDVDQAEFDTLDPRHQLSARDANRRPMTVGDSNDDEPETQFKVRPRPLGPPVTKRPVYKIRRFDTVRSIARDMLGSQRRAQEIIDLNRDVIDDPAHLVVGQLIELPEDARK
jgi:nucleoid-associated protein YgaU